MANRKRLGAQLLGWLAVVAIVATTAGFVLTRESALEVTAGVVERGHVEDTIPAIASGTVMLQVDSRVASDFMGTIEALHVKEGQQVKAGDLLLELRHRDLAAQVELARANLEVGKSRLRQAQLGVDIGKEVSDAQIGQATAQSELASSELEKLRSMLESGAISQTEFDRASVQSQVAAGATTVAIAGKRETLVREEEVQMAESNIKQLEAGVAAAEAARDKALLHAPFDGTVAKIFLDEGESVTMGMPMLQLIDNSEFYIEAPFDEANAAEIKVGQKVRINLDAYRGEDFAGRVEYIAPVVQINPDLSRTLNVKIRVEEGKDKFVGGMSADVIIIVNEKDGVLFIPSDAIIRDQYAYVVERGRAVRREVTIGIGNWERTEIVEGIQEGEQYITSVALQELADGVRIKVVEDLG